MIEGGATVVLAAHAFTRTLRRLRMSLAEGAPDNMSVPQIVRRLRSAVLSVVRPRVVIGAPDHRCTTLHLGSGYGGWTIHPDPIHADSVVY